MSIRNHFIATCVLLSMLITSVVIAEQNEALLMFHQEGYDPYVPGGGIDPGTPIRLVASDQDALPQDVQDDIVALNEAIVARTGGVFRRSIESTPNGRTLVVQKGLGQSEDDPEGVWIWPDWRNAENVLDFSDEYSAARFLSNYHVMLHGSGTPSIIIDWRNPDHAFSSPTVCRYVTSLRVADNGRWACETGDDKLRVGMLDPDNNDWEEIFAEVPVDAPIGEMMFLHGGQVLVMNVDPADGEKEIRTYTFPALDEIEHVSTHVGGYIYHRLTRLKDEHFFGKTWEGEFDLVEWNDELVVFTVDVVGNFIAINPSNYDQDGREAPTSVSPSGKFATTQRRNLVGGIVYGMRRTPLADPNDLIPSDEHGNRPGPPVWVSWGD